MKEKYTWLYCPAVDGISLQLKSNPALFLNITMLCHRACIVTIDGLNAFLVLAQILTKWKKIQNLTNNPGGADSVADGDFDAGGKCRFRTSYYKNW